ncbi:hypothetical protein [Rhizobium sp. 1399]|jgi:hypothetical protein|uniref:hypothetical protein n=1 Tax=unclassified Rhizobium TaxID=2613769 RepID=UPI000DE06883|nr:hypothetical protein [Rhizobium sp. 1399]MDR6670385.1 hypothetical protein [Rhizobium sp. 1399]
MTHASGRRLNASAKAVLASLIALTGLPLAAAEAQTSPFDQFPILIQCKYKETYHVFYISRISEDGVATYVASERMGGTITLDGQAKATGGASGGSCVGKTLAELRASHQAYDLKP